MQLVRNLAVEWGPRNVRANAIAPGLIRTDFAYALWKTRIYKKRTKDTPLKRIGEPDEIAGGAIFRLPPGPSGPAKPSSSMAACSPARPRVPTTRNERGGRICGRVITWSANGWGVTRNRAVTGSRPVHRFRAACRSGPGTAAGRRSD